MQKIIQFFSIEANAIADKASSIGARTYMNKVYASVKITNNEPMATVFHTVDAALGIIRCHYCDKEQQLGKVELCK